MKITLLILCGFIAFVVLGVVASLFLMRFSDGPKGPVPGGALVSGELVDVTDVKWDEVLGNQPVAEIELQRS